MRKAELKDLKNVMEIIEDGKLSLKEDGIDQWQNGLPKIDDIRKNIESNQGYVYIVDGEIVSFAYLKEDYEKDYEPIEKGFKKHDDFFTIHRLSIKKCSKGKGISKKFLGEIIAFAKDRGLSSVRIDTHRDNFKMKSLIKKFDFKKIGPCFVDDGKGRSERIAYELVL
ncbi:GNAT family N-acetyltransferase [Anaerococcus sp. AGMB00486]|uniref:GNAT family N-acetyltransferase n=2 Tax=Anaerococcus TaxID=165779 RepID=A0ABX2NC17_9FIRM|nr:MULTISPECIES: GNAT family N-acetyltransferase [Anaerococcus]MDY3006640.1 GNAT family N-acetyltransferase [Anaerococcus porci]MSS78107.1 GNAT family N-acetyltransferase [Anaerococcus porci]NVF12089.1 GNAT family N-acetyltransferase [Anaerococcus faecalis]